MTDVFDAGKLAPYHVETPAGYQLVNDSGNVLLLLLILLLCSLGTRDQPLKTEPAKPKSSGSSSSSKSAKTGLAKPASSQGLPSADGRVVVNDTCADMLLTTPSDVKHHIGAMALL